MFTVIFKILKIAVRAATPEIREQARNLYTHLKGEAAKTKNPIDDILVEILGSLLGFDD